MNEDFDTLRTEVMRLLKDSDATLRNSIAEAFDRHAKRDQPATQRPTHPPALPEPRQPHIPGREPNRDPREPRA